MRLMGQVHVQHAETWDHFHLSQLFRAHEAAVQRDLAGCGAMPNTPGWDAIVKGQPFRILKLKTVTAAMAQVRNSLQLPGAKLELAVFSASAEQVHVGMLRHPSCPHGIAVFTYTDGGVLRHPAAEFTGPVSCYLKQCQQEVDAVVAIPQSPQDTGRLQVHLVQIMHMGLQRIEEHNRQPTSISSKQPGSSRPPLGLIIDARNICDKSFDPAAAVVSASTAIPTTAAAPGPAGSDAVSSSVVTEPVHAQAAPPATRPISPTQPTQANTTTTQQPAPPTPALQPPPNLLQRKPNGLLW